MWLRGKREFRKQNWKWHIALFCSPSRNWVTEEIQLLCIIRGATTELLNNPFGFAILCFLFSWNNDSFSFLPHILSTVAIGATWPHPFDCRDRCHVANRFALCHNITQIRLNRVTHLLCFYRISLFGFSCAVVSLGLTHTMVVYSLIYSFIAVYWSTCNHCLLSHFMSCPLPFSVPWRSFFRFNKIC